MRAKVSVVGDPMQSIYGFREAEVSLFQRARQQGVSGWALTAEELRVNFRSQQRLIDWFNEAFPHILTEHDEVTGAVAYTRAEASRPPGPEPVSIHAFCGKSYEEEAGCVAGLIEQALAETESESWPCWCAPAPTCETSGKLCGRAALCFAPSRSIRWVSARRFSTWTPWPTSFCNSAIAPPGSRFCVLPIADWAWRTSPTLARTNTRRQYGS